jgi:hypothetical protein
MCAHKPRLTLSLIPNTKPFGLKGALAFNRSSSNARRVVIATCLSFIVFVARHSMSELVQFEAKAQKFPPDVQVTA